MFPVRGKAAVTCGSVLIHRDKNKMMGNGPGRLRSAPLPCSAGGPIGESIDIESG